MKTRNNANLRIARRLLGLLALLPAAVLAQVPVDENGKAFNTYEVSGDPAATGNEDIPLLSTVDLEELVGPIALYPDDLLAIVLPASAYPLQIIEAARFLEDIKNDPTLKPDPDWDDSVVALLNYPEVIEMLNDDIDWTWRLGEAVVAQQADVVATIEAFRDRAYAAGNLKSDDYQNVSYEDGVIEITPVSEEVIYVPYYEPDRVVVYQPRPVYYYYPRAYPVYYYPYSSGYRFTNNRFWGVTTAFRIGWYSDSLSVLHHSYYGHPYFGRQYRDLWWYRRPTINTHNVVYIGGNTDITVNRYYGGDRWRPRHDRRDYVRESRVTRNRSERRLQRQQRHPDGNIPRREYRDSSRHTNTRRQVTNIDERRVREPRDAISFRQRPATRSTNRRDAATERRANTSVRREQRRDRDVATTRTSISRQQALASARRKTVADSNRRSEYTFRQRTTTRQARSTTEVVQPRRAERSRTVTRSLPPARYERRDKPAVKSQSRRQEPATRRVESRRSVAPRPAPAKRQAPSHQTQRKSSGSPTRRASKHATKTK
ncbi:MAG: DUF3300 domain-containing protein [Gammaproteobacteria bacterium]|nr:DUF3300 domain-containing protein [Gammaproteobacteria bacterium]